jgi:hypothetical protein
LQRKATIQLWKKEVRRLKVQCLTFNIRVVVRKRIKNEQFGY